MINYAFYGVILMKYMGQHGTPMVPKILWCQSMISRLSNAPSAVFIRLLMIFLHLHEIWPHIFNFSKNQGFYLETYQYRKFITNVTTMTKLILILFSDCMISYIRFLSFWVPLGTIWVPLCITWSLQKVHKMGKIFQKNNINREDDCDNNIWWYPRWYPKSQKVDIWNHTIWKRYQNQFYHCWNVCYKLSAMLGFKVKTLIFWKVENMRSDFMKM